jgi:hypothetical protein
VVEEALELYFEMHPERKEVNSFWEKMKS